MIWYDIIWYDNEYTAQLVVQNFGLHLFLTCVSHTAHVMDIGCPSVCLSVTRWYCVETVQPIVKLFSLPCSPGLASRLALTIIKTCNISIGPILQANAMLLLLKRSSDIILFVLLWLLRQGKGNMVDQWKASNSLSEGQLTGTFTLCNTMPGFKLNVTG